MSKILLMSDELMDKIGKLVDMDYDCAEKVVITLERGKPALFEERTYIEDPYYVPGNPE